MKDTNLISYVKRAFDLETEQYKLTQMCSHLEQMINEQNRMILSEKLSDYLPIVNTPALLPDLNDKEKNLVRIGKIILGIFSLFMMIGIFSRENNLFEVGTVYDFVILFIMLVSGLLLVLCGKSFRNIRVSKTLEKIENQERQKQAVGEMSLAEAKDKNIIVRNNISNLQKEFSEYNGELERTRETLSFHYNQGIIHPIYQNFYCISKILYLLDVGIVEKLEGLDGAYSQLRLDCIIDNQRINNYLNSELLEQNILMNKAILKTNDSIKQLERQVCRFRR